MTSEIASAQTVRSRYTPDPLHGAGRRVVGADFDAFGYTTVGQADLLLDWLELSPRDRVLDVGSGRGWPGLQLARRSGCRLVSIDPSSSDVAVGGRQARCVGLSRWTRSVVADGRWLPFRPGSFDAVVHADVLC